MTSSESKTIRQKADAFWTADKLKKFTQGQKYTILPTSAPELLSVLGIMNKDASISSDAMRKFIQVNHLWKQFATAFEDLAGRHKLVSIVDAGCGSSVLTFTLAWGFENIFKKEAMFVGVDSNAKLIAKNKANFEKLRMGSKMEFFETPMTAFNWDVVSEPKSKRPHAVVALHACDTATDDAIAFGIKSESNFIAVAPCCQAELAQIWKTKSQDSHDHPLLPLYANPHLRREFAATMTDLIRVLVLRSHGYEVTTTEFTMSHATPKNTLILAHRRGRFHRESEDQLSKLLGHIDIETMYLLTQFAHPIKG
jgi:hypothetical protein